MSLTFSCRCVPLAVLNAGLIHCLCIAKDYLASYILYKLRVFGMMRAPQH
jgi:hypothetical protein